jgi:hypothetical protein
LSLPNAVENAGKQEERRPTQCKVIYTNIIVMRFFHLDRNALSSPQPLDVDYIVVERHLEHAAAWASWCCVAAAVGLFLGGFEV